METWLNICAGDAQISGPWFEMTVGIARNETFAVNRTVLYPIYETQINESQNTKQK